MMCSIRLVVMGVSAGGLEALRTILPELQPDFPVPVVVVQHMSPRADSKIPEILNNLSPLHVKEAEDKEPLTTGVVYIAPPDYHLLIEPDFSLSLSMEERVNFSRPSVDVLFESAADACGNSLLGVVLTGANNDGARGMARIKEVGGLAVIQDPATAHATAMPLAAMQNVTADYILPLPDIAPFLNHMTRTRHVHDTARHTHRR